MLEKDSVYVIDIRDGDAVLVTFGRRMRLGGITRIAQNIVVVGARKWLLRE